MGFFDWFRSRPGWHMVIVPGKDRRWRWEIVGRTGKVFGLSDVEGWMTKEGAEHGARLFCDEIGADFDALYRPGGR